MANLDRTPECGIIQRVSDDVMRSVAHNVRTMISCAASLTTFVGLVSINRQAIDEPT